MVLRVRCFHIALNRIIKRKCVNFIFDLSVDRFQNEMRSFSGLKMVKIIHLNYELNLKYWVYIVVM